MRNQSPCIGCESTPTGSYEGYCTCSKYDAWKFSEKIKIRRKININTQTKVKVSKKIYSRKKKKLDISSMDGNWNIGACL
jgi:hypothetical protein